MMKYGKVIITGAGPGDSALITKKGIDAITNCDVLLYDNLVNHELLSYCKQKTEKIFVGHKTERNNEKKEAVIQILIKKAKKGRNTVWLKGGDPLIFGSASEDAIELRKAGIEFEFIPGITIGAVATYAGIPMIHQDLVTQCVFVNAQESPRKKDAQVRWEHLAQMKNTNLIIYKGESKISVIVDTLIKYGMNSEMPAAIIENGTLPSQRTLIAALKDIPKKIIEDDYTSPLIFFIGPTVELRKQLIWTEKKPLFSKRIVATRAKEQAHSLYKKLMEEGAKVIPFKVIRSEISSSKLKLSEILQAKKFDWIIFSSENGVRYFFEQMKNEKIDARIFSDIKIAIIGKASAKRLSEFALFADFIPTKNTSKSMVQEFPKFTDVKGKIFLRVKGNFTKDILTEGLDKLGAKVETLEVYKLMQDKPDLKIIKDLKMQGADAFIFTSRSTVNNFFAVIGSQKAKELLSNSLVLSIGHVTSSALIEKNIRNITEAETQTIDGIMKTLIEKMQ